MATFGTAAQAQQQSPMVLPPVPVFQWEGESLVPKTEVKPDPVAIFDNLMTWVHDHHYAVSRLKVSAPIFGKLRDEVARKQMPALDAVNEALALLDPHSRVSFVRNEAPKKQALYGWRGLGLDVLVKDGRAQVANAFYRGNALKAGIGPLDAVTHIDGEALAGKGEEQILDALCSDARSSVTLTVVRDTAGSARDVRVECDLNAERAIDARLYGDIGYLRVDRFSEDAARDLAAAAMELEKRSPRGYVLDLRDDPGGYVDEAHQIIDAFLDSKKTMVRSISRQEDTPAKATRGDIISGKPLVVLINPETFSAAEMTAGSLQHYKRAVLIGAPSGGKGSIQTVYKLNAMGISPAYYEGTEILLKLTTAMFVMPDGASPQLTGLFPDIDVPATYMRGKWNPERRSPNALENPMLVRAAFRQRTKDSACIPDAGAISSQPLLKNPDGTPDLALICAFAHLNKNAIKTLPVASKPAARNALSARVAQP